MLIPVFILLLASGAMAKPNIAILTFGGDQTSTLQQLEAITERFQAELANTEKFQIVNRTQMDLILKEQGFQQTGICSSSECQVKIGQVLGVDKLIVGKVVSFGGVYSLSAVYLDVEKGIAEKTVSTEVKGELVSVLTDGCKRLSDALASKVFGSQYESQSAKQQSISKPKPISTWVGIGLDVVGAGLIAYGFYQNSVVDSNLEDYRDLPAGQENSVYDNSWNQVEDAKTNRNIGYAVGTALLAAGIAVHFVF